MVINIEADDKENEGMIIKISSTNDFILKAFEKTVFFLPEIYGSNSNIILKVTLSTVYKKHFSEGVESNVKLQPQLKARAFRPVETEKKDKEQIISTLPSDIDNFFQSEGI